MKKTLLSLMLSVGVSAPVLADDLLQVYQQALANDPVVNRAKAQRDAAYEGISISRASLLPQISGSIGYSMSSGEDTDPTSDDDGNFTGFNIFSVDRDTLSYGIDFSMSLYDHANWIGMDRAEKVAQQSDAQYGAAMQELIVRTVTAYLDVLRARDNVEFVRAEKRAIERQLEQTKQRFEVGLTAITDVHEAQANFDNTLAQEIRAENQLELALEAMRVITGKYHDRLFGLNTERFSATAPSPAKVDEWLTIAEESNLELLAQRFAKDIAQEDIDAKFAGHLPTLGLNGEWGRSRTDVSSGGQSSQLPWLDSQRITLNLSVPIYSGGATSASTDQARYNYVAASETLVQTHRQTVQSIRSSFNDVKASISTIRALEQAVVSAQSALQATEAGFDVGTRTIVDVLNSTRNLFDARRNLSGARYDFIQAIVSLKRAAGNLTNADIEQINRGLEPMETE